MSLEDNELYYEIVGDGEPIVMLHGFTGTRHTWGSLKTFLSDYQLILFDLPGHGCSKGYSLTSMKACCKQLRKQLNKMNIMKFHLVGYSMGGRTAIHFANEFPHMVQSLILESASPGLSSELEQSQRQQNDKNLANYILQNGIEEFVNYWQDIPLFLSQKELSEEKQQQIRNERLSHQREGLVHSLHSMGTGAQPSFWNDLEQMIMRVLLVVGEKDSKFVKINNKMREKLPNAELTVCKNVGHAVHVENPQIFGKIVEEFLNRNPIAT
ncbi:2-succinyl-6-hydroxy-2,4-cyclohexadiene-1-carboxylate synthase [Oceanobacillus kimchii]|uniref:2-succinyl-6-hydroxy-2, 4-cyclohexadiene-1-carboxylate synthase n=1 Tax=Oceanobacillus kimchii TaxID=746691 RepID=UPI00034D7F12|nr:2-succinyl-6-hydroxy-2,4-cyclohexadiene-1-carboxylate synthase [Oceanobacillus kimchii]